MRCSCSRNAGNARPTLSRTAKSVFSTEHVFAAARSAFYNKFTYALGKRDPVDSCTLAKQTHRNQRALTHRQEPKSSHWTQEQSLLYLHLKIVVSENWIF